MSRLVPIFLAFAIAFAAFFLKLCLPNGAALPMSLCSYCMCFGLFVFAGLKKSHVIIAFIFFRPNHPFDVSILAEFDASLIVGEVVERNTSASPGCPH